MKKVLNGWVKYSLIVAALSTMAVSSIVQSASNDLRLVGNRVATLIDDQGRPARANAIVKAVLSDKNVKITATTQAWSGSGLKNGKFDGYIDHYSLSEPKSDYIYTNTYASIPLHIASTKRSVKDISSIESVYRQRVGIENRFANTDELRGERAVRWARSPEFFTNIQQLAGQRVDYIIADKYMLLEFNKLLLAKNEEPLYISEEPLYLVDMQLAIKANFENAQSIVKRFNKNLDTLKESGDYTNLYIPTDNAPSILREGIYSEILKKW